MEGIGGLRRNEFMGFRAHEHVGGFDADDQIVVAFLLNHMNFIQSTLHNTLCGDAMVFLH